MFFTMTFCIFVQIFHIIFIFIITFHDLLHGQCVCQSRNAYLFTFAISNFEEEFNLKAAGIQTNNKQYHGDVLKTHCLQFQALD